MKTIWFGLMRRFDKLREPWRFIVFMAILGPVAIAANSNNLPFMFGGIALLLAVLFLRIWYLGSPP